MSAEREPPAFFQTKKTADGKPLKVLRPYWRRRPIVEPAPCGVLVDVAFWPDGRSATVPRGTRPAELEAYWLASVDLAAAGIIADDEHLRAQIQAEIDERRAQLELDRLPRIYDPETGNAA